MEDRLGCAKGRPPLQCSMTMSSDQRCHTPAEDEEGRTGPRCFSRPTPLIEKASKHSAGGRSSSKVGMLGRKVSFRSCTLRNSANAATCSLEVVAKMPQHAAKCQRGQGVWQAVKSLLKLLHRLEVKLWRQQKLAPHFCTTLGWQKFGDTLSLSSALVFPGTEKRGAANNHHLGWVFFSFCTSKGEFRSKWETRPYCSISREGNWLLPLDGRSWMLYYAWIWLETFKAVGIQASNLILMLWGLTLRDRRDRRGNSLKQGSWHLFAGTSCKIHWANIHKVEEAKAMAEKQNKKLQDLYYF